MLSIKEIFEREYEIAKDCCLHNPQFAPDDVEKVIAVHYVAGDYAESDTTALVRLKNGRVGIFTASEDTTGHGCRCGSSTTTEASLHAALTHLTEQELEELLENSET